MLFRVMKEAKLSYSTNPDQRRDRGFTLVEVLVALGVLSIAVLALLNVQGVSASLSSAVRDRLFAEIIAENLLVEAVAAPVELPLGETNGETEIAGQAWVWSRAVSATSDRDIKRVDVAVRIAPGESALIAVSAFRGLR